MTSKPHIEAGIAIVVMVLGPLALAGFLFKTQKPQRRLAQIDQPIATCARSKWIKRRAMRPPSRGKGPQCVISWRRQLLGVQFPRS